MYLLGSVKAVVALHTELHILPKKNAINWVISFDLSVPPQHLEMTCREEQLCLPPRCMEEVQTPGILVV